MSKKGGDAKGKGGAGSDPMAEDPSVVLAKERSVFTMASAFHGSDMTSTYAELKRLSEENAAIKRIMSAQEAKAAETHAQLQRRVDTLADQLFSAETRSAELQSKLARVPLEIKAAADAAKAVVHAEVDDLTRKLRDRDVALERLADFRKERDDLMEEVRLAKEALEKEQMAHQHDIAAMERRNIKDR